MCSRSAPGGPGRANELGGQMVNLLTLAVFATIDEAAISGLKHAAAICGPQVVADFHTHVCSIHNQAFADFFSMSDAIVNQELHTVGYMLSLCDWNIRRYDPSQDDRDDEEVDFRSGRVIYLTCGHIVGWVPPLPEEEVALELTVARRRNRLTTHST